MVFRRTFDNGWELIYKNENIKIKDILKKVDYIWISHEHPDHFSIQFFKDYYDFIKEKKIKFIFQKTKDQRVYNFLKQKKLEVHELKNNTTLEIDKNFTISVQSTDFYDSALIIKLNEKKIFNLNDCPLNTYDDLNKFKRIYGNCDFLMTQFSYAAWKGGKKNLKWRKTAANEKLKTLIKQSNILNPKYLIPFASFIYFSDQYNYYMNDSSNTPDKVLEIAKDIKSKILFLKPYETIFLNDKNIESQGYEFWKNQYNLIPNKKYYTSHDYKQYDLEKLNAKFIEYRKNLFLNNSLLLSKIISKFKFLKIFSPIVIKLKDIEKTILVDLLEGKLDCSNLDPDVEMNSKSLYLIFDQGYGYDTLTVNGCFEELSNDGFIKMTQSLALGNLNNIGIFLKLSIIFDFKTIILFFKKIFKLKKKINFDYIQNLD